MNWRRNDCFISGGRIYLSPQKEEERQEKSIKWGVYGNITRTI
jgi:hypothetical protein